MKTNIELSFQNGVSFLHHIRDKVLQSRVSITYRYVVITDKYKECTMTRGVPLTNTCLLILNSRTKWFFLHTVFVKREKEHVRIL